MHILIVSVNGLYTSFSVSCKLGVIFRSFSRILSNERSRVTSNLPTSLETDSEISIGLIVTCKSFQSVVCNCRHSSLNYDVDAIVNQRKVSCYLAYVF